MCTSFFKFKMINYKKQILSTQLKYMDCKLLWKPSTEKCEEVASSNPESFWQTFLVDTRHLKIYLGIS